MKSHRLYRHVVGTLSSASAAPFMNPVEKPLPSRAAPRFPLGRVALVLLTAAASLHAAQFYVAPTGASSGDGSLTKPWDLQTALNQPSAVRPGDTIWLRGGTYQVGGKPYRFTSALTGTASAPITVRNYNYERAIVDGNLQAWSGGYVTFWGLEITDSWPGRTSTQSGPWPTTWQLNNGLGQLTDYCVSGADLRVPSVKMINCLLHDNIGGGFGMTTAAVNTELYGCLSYFNGWLGSDRGHGHGAYLQGTGTTKITNCIFFNNSDHGMQVYGSSSVTLSGYQLTGNLFFDNGSLFAGSTSGRNLLVGGDNVSQNNSLRNNSIYRTVGTLSVSSDFYMGYIGGTSGLILSSNTVVGSMLFDVGSDSSIAANSFLGTLAGLSSSSYPANTYTTARPTTGNLVIVRPNQYETGRGHIIIYNWQGSATVNADLSSLGLHTGDTFDLHNVQNYFGDVQSFTYSTSTLAVPMTGHTVAPPAGSSPASTFPAFGAFVLVKTGSGSGTSATNTPPTISSIANQSINANTSAGPLAVTVGDAETAAGSLTLTAASSNTALVLASGIALGGSGAARTVTVTPAANQSGAATITLTVSDGSLTTSTSFTVTVNAPPPVETAPTISSVANQSINANTSAGPLAVTVGDAQTSAGSLTLTAASSNTALVPASGIALGGSGAARTVTVTPAANQSGAATITLTVSDGSLTTSTSFTVTVNAPPPVETAPTISSVANQSINANTSAGPLAVTVGDAQTSAGSLTLTAASSNTALVPASGIALGGSGAARTVTVTPAANQSGAATITLTVSDGSLTTSTSFTVTVNAPPPVETAPTISSVANQSINANTSAGPLAVTVGDAQTSAGSLTLTAASSNTALVPASGIALGGSGAARTVTVTPAANQSGAATITLTVSDGSLSASTSFTVTVAAVNTAPTISSVANQSINANTSAGPLAVTVGDAQTSAGSLTLTAASSNTALVPASGIALGGSGAARTVTVTPAANQSGAATITLTVSDGSLSTSTSFTVTVAAVNTAPTISSVANQSINANTSAGPLAVTVGDAQTSAGSLTLTAASSNTALVPASGIALGGSGAARTLTVTPAANQSGAATITLTVSDGSLSTSTSFTVTVAAVNTAPTISSVANQSINANTSTGPLAVTVGDAETAAGSLTLTAASSNTALVPASGIALGGSGAARTVTVTPAANQSGAATITLTVSDGSLSASTSFTVTVAAVNTAPTISSVANQSINANTSAGPLAVTVGDAETAAGNLALTAVSSNTALVPASGVALSGSDANRTVSVAPAADQSGIATITLTVSDGSLSTSTSFTITVAAASGAPTVSSIANQTISANTSTGPLTFSVGCSASQVKRLSLRQASSNPGLIPAANVVLSNSRNHRYVTVTPLANQTGTATITVSASDNSGTGQSSFQVNVLPARSNRTGGTVLAGSSNAGPTIDIDPWTVVGDLPLLLADENATFQVDNTGPLTGGATYTWDFGDGTSSTLAQPVHAFTNCGPYSVTATINDGAATQTAGLRLAVPCQLSLQQLVLQADFRVGSTDRCKLVALLGLDPSFNPDGQSVTVSVGGSTVTFTLDSRGTAAGTFGNARLAFDRQTQTWRLLAVLHQPDWHQSWATAGLINADVPAPGAAVTVPLIVLVGDEAFAADAKLTYVAQVNHTGVAR